MRHVVIGTAGHVDHGKTSLVKRLTGVNTDRLKEEQLRGMTIELGFAPFTLPSGRRAAIVDVPGHERFIHHMLAGVAGIDIVLLVVAADEGVMPQTVEHLDILTILGVTRGLIVLNKIDLVDPEWRDLVAEEIREKVRGTALAESPVFPVSAVTGEGVDALVKAIDEVTKDAADTARSTYMRLPVDRVFGIQGHGTVVTGTLWGGRISPGDTVEIQPQGEPARVRQVQVHDETVPSAEGGQRVALNLAGVEKEAVPRGSVIAEPGLLSPTTLVDATLSLLPHAPRGLEHRDRCRIHTGTTEVLARVRLLAGDSLAPGESTYVQLHLEEPVVALRGDLFVIRSYSPAHTLGGGRMLDTRPPRRRRLRDATLSELRREDEGRPADLVAISLERAGTLPLTKEFIRRRATLSTPVVLNELKEAARTGRAVALGDNLFLSARGYQELRDAIRGAVKEFHDKFPLRAGIGREELRSRFATKWDAKDFTLLLGLLQGEGVIATQGQEIALPGRVNAGGGDLEAQMKKLEEHITRGGVAPPTLAEVGQKTGLSPKQAEELAAALVKQSRLVKVSEELYYSPAVIGDIRRGIVEHFAVNATLEAGAFKDRLGVSRKFAIPLLEYFDRERVTRRQGDQRIPGPGLHQSR